MARQTICLNTHCSGMRDIKGDGVYLLPASEMIWTSILTVPPPLSVVPSVTAHSLIKILHLEKKHRDYWPWLR